MVLAYCLQLEGTAGWDPAATLNWSSRGVGPNKMGALRDTLYQNSVTLTGLQLGGGFWLGSGCQAALRVTPVGV